MTKNRILRLSDRHWARLLSLAHEAGYPDRATFVRAFIDGAIAPGPHLKAPSRSALIRTNELLDLEEPERVPIEDVY